MSTWAELIASYLRERYRSRLFVPLALLLAITGMFAAGSRVDAPSAVIASVITCYLLVLAFRVWDDLEDRARDRRDHPERVLARSTSTLPWVVVLAVTFGTAVAIIATGAQSVQRILIIAAGTALILVWYRVRRSLHASPLVGMAIIFAKYPLIAFVAAPPARPTPVVMTATSLAALYVVLGAYELIDDTALRGSIP